MPKKLALDYDASELRIVVANCNAARVSVTDVAVIPIGDDDSVSEKLRGFINANGLQKTEALIAIGRGKAELRELQLPPVPEEELPDMVRFQAIRSFASASDRAIVDYLVTDKNAEGHALIAAAVSPQDLKQIHELCGTSELIPKRVALRPLTAASLYLRQATPPPICVMIDLLADEAEIVVARAGKVIFVRTVRLPSEDEYRPAAIASELRRTMVACGETSQPDRIVVWGTAAVHAADVDAIKAEVECDDVLAVDPFSMVELKLDQGALPEHVGRLAPLVGLLASDEAAPETLIDFLNPRERQEPEPDRLRRALMIAGPLVAVFLIGFFVYRQFAEWDRKIAQVTNEINLMKPSADKADVSIGKTEKVDLFLDGDVNWLDELRRFANEAPPSDKLMVDTIYASSDIRKGGGDLRFTGTVVQPNVIDEMEASLRDESHRIIGKGSQQQSRERGYRWDFTETISLTGATMRNLRYERMTLKQAALDEVAAAEKQGSADSKGSEEAGSSKETDSAAPEETNSQTDERATPEGSLPAGEDSNEDSDQDSNESNEVSA